MLVSYDFDIHWIIPRDLEADPAIKKLLGDIGFNSNARGNYVALFRDPAVVSMIERADPVLRDFLKACGFGFVASGSALPAGFYPPEDEGALTDVIQRLHDTLPEFSMAGADLGGFDFAAFLRAVTNAKPLPEDAGQSRKPRVAPVHHDTARQEGDVAYAASAGRGRVGSLVLNLGGLLLMFYVAVKLFATPAAF